MRLKGQVSSVRQASLPKIIKGYYKGRACYVDHKTELGLEYYVGQSVSKEFLEIYKENGIIYSILETLTEYGYCIIARLEYISKTNNLLQIVEIRPYFKKVGY